MSDLLSYEPYSGALCWQGTESSEQICVDAVATAADAWQNWAALSHEQRVAILYGYRDRVVERKAELAELISRETGKALWDATTEAGAVAAKVDLICAAWDERCAEKSNEVAGKQTSVRPAALGVCVVIGPFNFPAHLPNGQIIPALLAGNSVVFKPAETAPAVGAWLVQRLHEAGVPETVVSCVQGGRAVGAKLIEQPAIAAVYFTGSWQAGCAIHRQLAGRPDVLLALEMGGNNPLIITDDVTVDHAARIAVVSACISAGQRCTCARRIFLPTGAQGDAVLAGMVNLIKHLRIGNPLSSDPVFCGPLIHAAAANALYAREQLCVDAGGTSILPVEQLEGHSHLVRPGIIDVSQCAMLPDEEVFGPLVHVYRVSDFETALQQANASCYGLSASLISNNPEDYQRFRKMIRAGLVNWNVPTTGASGRLPFGGMGHSGNHRSAGWHAVDFCSFPVASVEQTQTEEIALQGLGP